MFIAGLKNNCVRRTIPPPIKKVADKSVTYATLLVRCTPCGPLAFSMRGVMATARDILIVFLTYRYQFISRDYL